MVESTGTFLALPMLDAHIGKPLDLAGIPNHVDRLILIRSDAAPYVPPSHNDRPTNLLGTTTQVIPRAGHFLASDGVTSLPAALEAIASSRKADGRLTRTR